MAAVVEKFSTDTATWRSVFVWYGVVGIVLLIVLGESYWTMVQTWWRSSTFFHCFIIAPISAWLIFERRHAIAKIQPQPILWPIILVLGLTLLWMLASLSKILLFQQAIALLLIPLALWMLVGNQATKAMLFPLAFLMFSLPVGEALVPWLQDLTADISVWGLRNSGLPVYLEGRHIQIPRGNFVVAKACSGIRYLIASVSINALFAYLFYRSGWKWVIYLLLAVLVPLLANGVRAYFIIMLAHWSNMQLATGVDHLIYGWVFFTLIMALMFWVGLKFRDDIPTSSNPAPTTAIHTVAPARFAVWHAASLFSGVLLIIGLLYQLVYAQQVVEQPFKLTAPTAIGRWQGPTAMVQQNRPRLHHASQTVGAVYQLENKKLNYFAAYFSASQAKAELINSEHKWYADPWLWVASEEKWLEISASRVKVKVLLLRHKDQDQRRLLWYWYDIAGQLTGSDLSGKWYELKSRLQLSTLGSAAIVLAVDYDSRRLEAEQQLTQFITAMSTGIQSSLWQR